MRKRREIEGQSLSFLDCIACGFGAIILLLVIVKTTEPVVLEASTVDYNGRIQKLQEELVELRGEVTTFNRALKSETEQLSEDKRRLARLSGDLSDIEGAYKATEQDSSVANILEGRLASARQSLTEEMKRLQVPKRKRELNDSLVAGIPVDSEYVVFIIDTSGSMYNYAWDMVVQKVEETLNVYPTVKGIQVMNDMGNYMFSRYRGDWIPDSPARRRAIVNRLRNWQSFSNSSPVEGITRAIQDFYSRDKKISLYVFGDEFTGGSIQAVVDSVDRINQKNFNGERLVRIHGVGFPTMFVQSPRLQITGIRFATLMRILCERNEGTFVALNDFRG
ncbi:MAG: VWA domain-containing protein [Gammaproteobacteria bacterium]